MTKRTLRTRLTAPSSKGSGMRAGLIAAMIAVAVVLNVVIFGLANVFSWYFYTEESYEHTIGDATDTYLSSLGEVGDVRIIFCDAADTLSGDTVYNLVWQTANQFADRYDFVSVENVNIFTHPERVERFKYEWDSEKNDFATDPETGDRIQLYSINTSSVIFAGEKDFIVLPMSAFFVLDSESVITAYNGEEVTAAMIRWTLTEDHPTAYFTANHGETYSSVFYNRLVCAGYRVQAIDLLTEEIAPDGILVISNPLYDFVEGNADKNIRAELEKMEEFLAGGGSMYVMLDPLVTNTVRLEAFLAEWGLTREAMTVRDSAEAVTTDGYALITSFADGQLANRFAAEMESLDAGRVILKQASPLTLTQPDGKTVEPILTSSPDARAYANGVEADATGSYVLAAASRDQNGGSIFLVSSVYMTAYDAITTNEYGNRDLLFLLFEELSGAAVPKGCSYLIFSPTTLEDLTMREARLWTALLAVVAPLAVAVAGMIVLKKRRAR